MRIEFTFVPSAFPTASSTEAALPFYFDPERSDAVLAELEACAFDGVVVDDAGGLLTNFDLAGYVGLRTSSLRVGLTHWAGVLAPTVAARQITALDRRTGGRAALRILVDGLVEEPGGTVDRHVNAWRRTDEYLVLLMRLLANDRPFDHVGPFYSVQQGFVPNKGPSGFAIPIRMRGRSGTALEVAARHADVLELPAASPLEIARLIERARNAAAVRGRAGKIRFALPVSIGHGEIDAFTDPEVAVSLPRLDERAVGVLLSYVDAGVSEFMVTRSNDSAALQAFSRYVATPVREAVARRLTPPAELAAYGENIARLTRPGRV